MEMFDFSEALRRLREGKRVRRQPWLETTWVAIGKNGQFMLTESWRLTPWAPFLNDLDATDWVEVPEGG